jgi:hypothetical protein
MAKRLYISAKNYYLRIILSLMIRFLRLIMLCVVVAMVSCAAQKWTNISSEVNVEELLHTKFPKLYKQYKEGRIEITRVERGVKNGEEVYRVTYGDVYSGESDILEWLPVFMNN